MDNWTPIGKIIGLLILIYAQTYLAKALTFLEIEKDLENERRPTVFWIGAISKSITKLLWLWIFLIVIPSDMVLLRGVLILVAILFVIYHIWFTSVATYKYNKFMSTPDTYLDEEDDMIDVDEALREWKDAFLNAEVNKKEIINGLKIGQRVKIIKNLSAHGFDIGQVVEIVGLDRETGMLVTGNEIPYRLVTREEFLPEIIEN